jgi:hypothetical protein
MRKKFRRVSGRYLGLPTKRRGARSIAPTVITERGIRPAQGYWLQAVCLIDFYI